MIRYVPYLLSLLLTAFSGGRALHNPDWIWGLVVFGALAAVGTHDVMQRKRTLLRSYPILAHFRYGLESIGPDWSLTPPLPHLVSSQV